MLNIKSELSQIIPIIWYLYLCCFFHWKLKFQHCHSGEVAATFQEVSILKSFVRFYPLWNVFWAVPSKGISGMQVTLSQCHHISQGKQNNPKREPKEGSSIIWLPSQAFPPLNSSKGQSLHGTVVFQHKLHLLLHVSSFVTGFVFRNQDVINFPTHEVANIAGLDFHCSTAKGHDHIIKYRTSTNMVKQSKIQKKKLNKKNLFSAQYLIIRFYNQ